MAEAVKKMRQSALELQGQLVRNTSPRQRRWMVWGLLGLVVMSASLLWLSARVEWRTLYSNLDPKEAQQAAAELAAEKISYQIEADGTTLRVPAPVVDKARLALASKGLPQSGRLGFELFDKPNWIGSEFDEKVNYQRALEGELEHTIGSMGAIQSARVHLVLPHDSLFENTQRSAKASVILKLAHRGLSDTEADAIRTLVGSAVDGLEPDHVTLVDADGRVSFGAKDPLGETALYEQTLSDRLVATLEPIAGKGNIRTSVNVEYDTSSQDETQEIYDPNGTVMVSTQRTEQTPGGQTTAAGVPGTASNAPNSAGATEGTKPANALPLMPPSTTAGESMKQESGSYLASKRVRHVVQGPGQVKRLTIAVLVNDKLGSVGTGKGAHMGFISRSPDEVKRMEDLARAAVGFNAARGDQIAVENIGFAENVVPTPPTALQRFMPRQQQVAQAMWLVGPIAMFLLLFFFVLKPAGRHIAQQIAQPELALAGGISASADGAESELAAGAAPALGSTRPVGRLQSLSDTIAQRIATEPVPMVRLVKSWINENGSSAD